MKAILVIDIPDYVNSVANGILKPIGTVGKLEIGYGSDDGEMTRFQLINTEGALLKPMPMKKIHIGKYNIWKECSKEDKKIMLENKGYNKCIDEIIGEKE